MYTVGMESYELSSYSIKGNMFYLLVCLVGFHVYRTGASCTEEQVQKCRQAADDESLSTLEGGGSCASQRYVHYTHTCTVSDYRPHIDFCCCAADVKVLCCRYQQSWDRFRCSEAEDTIHTLSPKSLPLHILLPCILAPVLILGCFIYCCVRHCRYCHDDGDDDTRWSCRCWSPEKKKNGGGVTLTDPSRPYQFQNSHSGLSGFSENEPLNTILPGLLVDAQKRPLEDSPNSHSSEGSRLMPSAPPFDDGDDGFSGGGPCHHLPQAPAAFDHPSATRAYGRQASVYSAPPGVFVRQDSAMPGGAEGGAAAAAGGYFIRQESAPCGPMAPVYDPQPQDNGVNGSSIAGNHQHYGGVHINVNGARGACPSCSSGVCAPPTYDESLQHQVLHQ